MIIFFPEVSRSLPDLLNTEEESDVVEAERVKRSALCPGVCSAKTFMFDFLLIIIIIIRIFVCRPYLTGPG